MLEGPDEENVNATLPLVNVEPDVLSRSTLPSSFSPRIMFAISTVSGESIVTSPLSAKTCEP